jgi:hypothetical protein
MFLGLLDPEPEVPIRIWIRLWLLPFSHDDVERTEIMLENQILTQSFSKKSFLRLKMMCLWISLKI